MLPSIERQDISNGTVNLVHDIVVSFDVNTAQVSADKNFKYGDLLVFAENASEFVTNVLKEIEE